MNVKKREPELDPELPEDVTRWSEREREEVEEAIRETTDEDRERAVRAFTRLAGRPRGNTFGKVWLAAAVLAVAVGLGWFLRGMGSDAGGARGDLDNRTWMGSSSDNLLVPKGAGASYDRFEWIPAGDGVARYGLRVWNAGNREPIVSQDGLTDESYEPTPDELSRLGPAIRWEVRRLDANNRQIGLLGSATASGSSSR